MAALVTTLAAADAAHGASSDVPDSEERIAGLDVAIWEPMVGSDPRPLVLFSHGYGGCKNQSNHLARTLANRGMLIVAPDHEDSRCGADRPPERLPPDLLNPNNWSATFHDDRRDDLRKLRAALQADERFSRQIDTKRVALVGHSLGGYTVLGLAGAWPSWKMDEVAAVVALAPFADPFLNGGTLEKVSAPVLFETGTADLAITEALEHRGIFAKTAAPACKVVYHGADHFAWTNLRTDFQDATAAAAAAFLDEAFAKRRPTAAILASSQTARAECK